MQSKRMVGVFLLVYGAMAIGGWSVTVSDDVLPTTRKRLIYYGWGTRDTIYVREHWQEMEKMPFDGIGITVAIDRKKPTVGDGATDNILGWNTFGPKPLRMDDFRPTISDLKAAKWKKFTNNFMVACIASRDQDPTLTGLMTQDGKSY